ncbi:MAG TPA: winged helix DNA-binding domain-containing protein [Gaiella sp.]|nr:winged helix DNA-binding domain-containing protein [Gaiella sp.]
MRSKTATQVTSNQVAAFRLGRHHLARRAPKEELVSVVGDMAGAQAQVLSAAQIALATRTADLSLADVGAAIAERLLVKVGCMRRTLYLVPSSVVAVFVRGTARRAEKEVRWALRKGVPSRVIEAAIGAALNALDEPLTRPEIAERACRTLGVRPRLVHGGGWGSRGKVAAVPVGALTYPVVDLLHLAAARGVVCYGDQRSGEPTFVRADAWVPGYEDVPTEDAEDRLLRCYLESFGPATVADFAVWSGMTLREARSIWARSDRELAAVDVDDGQASVLHGSLDELLQAMVETPNVRLLPYFDSYLLGHRDRRQLVSDEHRQRVSRSQGWIAPVVLVDGRVAGVWKHARRRGRLEVEVTPLEHLPRRVVSAIRDEADALRRFLGVEDVLVTIAAG